MGVLRRSSRHPETALEAGDEFLVAWSCGRRWGRGGEVLGGFASGGEDFYEAVDVGQFEGGIDHSGDAGEVQGAAYHAQARERFHDPAYAVAVNFGELGEVENDAGLFFFQEVVHSEFKAFAFDTHLKRPL